MNYKIVVDSCCELPEALLKSGKFERVPLSLQVGEFQMEDDESFDQAYFLKKVAECPECPKSSCPSPERYMNAFDSSADHIYAVTLSSHLSGSYNSAVLGKNLLLEKYADKQIHVVDSESASCGEMQIALKLMELEEEGFSFEEIVEKIEQFRDEMNTYFVLDNLETLRKNGRLSRVKSLVASTLSIKPIMAAEEGTIIQLAQSMGMKKALQKMADMLVKVTSEPEKKRLMISYCNCLERAETFKKLMQERAEFKEVILVDMAGISSTYANDGGIIANV